MAAAGTAAAGRRHAGAAGGSTAPGAMQRPARSVAESPIAGVPCRGAANLLQGWRSTGQCWVEAPGGHLGWMPPSATATGTLSCSTPVVSSRRAPRTASRPDPHPAEPLLGPGLPGGNSRFDRLPAVRTSAVKAADSAAAPYEGRRSHPAGLGPGWGPPGGPSGRGLAGEGDRRCAGPRRSPRPLTPAETPTTPVARDRPAPLPGPRITAHAQCAWRGACRGPQPHRRRRSLPPAAARAAGKRAPLRGSVAPRAEQGESQPLEVLRRENELLKKTISTAETAGKQPRRKPAGGGAASCSPGWQRAAGCPQRAWRCPSATPATADGATERGVRGGRPVAAPKPPIAPVNRAARCSPPPRRRRARPGCMRCGFLNTAPSLQHARRPAAPTHLPAQWRTWSRS